MYSADSEQGAWSRGREGKKEATKTLELEDLIYSRGTQDQGNTWKMRGGRFRYNILKHFQTTLSL